jgi:hypothetical protein
MNFKVIYKIREVAGAFIKLAVYIKKLPNSAEEAISFGIMLFRKIYFLK